MELNSLDIGRWKNSQFLYQLYYNSRFIWSLVYQLGYISYPNYGIFAGENSFVSPLSLCIEHLPKCYSVSSPLDIVQNCRSLREHISLALPTEMVFYLLRPTSLYYLPPELLLDMLETIIKWLQVSVTECNRQTPQTTNLIFV